MKIPEGRARAMRTLVAMLLVVLCAAAPAWAVGGDPAVLFIGSSLCAAPPGCPLFMGTELNPLPATNLTITENGAGQPNIGVNPVLLILGVPNTTSFVLPAITLSTGAGDIGGTATSYSGSWSTTTGLATTSSGSYTAAFSPPKGTPDSVYSFLGVVPPGSASESFTNWHAADQAVLGINATGFGVYVYVLTGTGLSGGGSVMATFASGLPLGTFAVAYGCSDVPLVGACSGEGNAFSTPFTQAGLVVPEPGTLLLLGSGLVAVGGAWKRGKFTRRHPRG